MSIFGSFSDFLQGPVGNNLKNNPQDVRNTKRNLHQAGYFNDAIGNDFMTRELDQGIRTYQRENNLKQDGILRPHGETELSLFRALSNRNTPAEPGQDSTPLTQTQKESRLAEAVVRKHLSTPNKTDTAGEDTPIPPNSSAKTHNDVFDKFRENLAPREGGIANRPASVDPGGLTNKGMSQRYLDQLNKRSPELGLPKISTDLSDEQIDTTFRTEYFDRPQIGKLYEVAGEHITGSKLVEHVFDAHITTGPLTVGGWLQKSIDETIGTDLTVNINGQKEYDGILGSKTRQALEQAVKENKAKEINKRFSDKRINYMRDLENYPGNKGGWEDRVQELRD